MPLKEIIKFIKSRKEDQIKFSFHSRIRFPQRNLNEETIIYYLLNSEPIKIRLENKNVYKLWYQYNKIEDLRIVLTPKENRILIITIIPEVINKLK